MKDMSIRKPEIIIFAGQNGSGKSTLTEQGRIIEPYINANDDWSKEEVYKLLNIKE